MKKATQSINPIMVDIPTACTATSLSKNTLMKIAKEANAIVDLGIRRKLINMQALQYYINSKTGGGTDDN